MTGQVTVRGFPGLSNKLGLASSGGFPACKIPVLFRKEWATPSRRKNIYSFVLKGMSDSFKA